MLVELVVDVVVLDADAVDVAGEDAPLAVVVDVAVADGDEPGSFSEEPGGATMRMPALELRWSFVPLTSKPSMTTWATVSRLMRAWWDWPLKRAASVFTRTPGRAMNEIGAPGAPE